MPNRPVPSCLILLAAAFLATPAGARIGPKAVEAIGSLDANFICPQFLPSDEERLAERTRFARQLAAAGLSFAEAEHVRAAIITRHNCVASQPEEVPADAAMVHAE